MGWGQAYQYNGDECLRYCRVLTKAEKKREPETDFKSMKVPLRLLKPSYFSAVLMHFNVVNATANSPETLEKGECYLRR